MAEVWTLSPGNTILRTDLHDRFGGSRQGGISPSASSPNVFLFSDPKTGAEHGYIDSWKADGLYHYTGEGQRGDQQIRAGNKAILNHLAEGRALRLFEGSGGSVKYVGPFEVDGNGPYYTTDAPETGGGPIRAVIVFRLRPIDVPPQAPRQDPEPPPAELQIVEVAIEQNETERFFVDPNHEVYEAERREGRLVREFCDFIGRQGQKSTRFRIVPPGEAKPLLCDVWVAEIGLLVEAKGSVTRGSVRMALGQLLDYARFLRPKRSALLLPSIPRPDLVALIACAGVELHVPDGRGGFVQV